MLWVLPNFPILEVISSLNCKIFTVMPDGVHKTRNFRFPFLNPTIWCLIRDWTLHTVCKTLAPVKPSFKSSWLRKFRLWCTLAQTHTYVGNRDNNKNRAHLKNKISILLDRNAKRKAGTTPAGISSQELSHCWERGRNGTPGKKATEILTPGSQRLKWGSYSRERR